MKNLSDRELVNELESACHPDERIDTQAQRAEFQDRIGALWAEVKRRGLTREQIDSLRITRGSLKLHPRPGSCLSF